jgi:hypothetical protein
LEKEPRNPILKQLNLFEAGIYREYRSEVSIESQWL